MYKKILCPTDFSETSIEAVRAANTLAKALGSELHLLHVVSPAPLMPDMQETPLFDSVAYEEAWTEEAERRLTKLVETHVAPGVRVRQAILAGHAAQTIDQYAMDEDVDLIVIATHGMTGWRHYLMGSVAQKVIQHTCLPVLIVRGPAGSRVEPGMA